MVLRRVGHDWSTERNWCLSGPICSAHHPPYLKNIHSLIHLYGLCFSIRGPHKDHLNGSQRKNKHEGSHEPLGNNCLNPSTSMCMSHHPFPSTPSLRHFHLYSSYLAQIPCALSPRLILPLEGSGHLPACADSYALAFHPGGALVSHNSFSYFNRNFVQIFCWWLKRCSYFGMDFLVFSLILTIKFVTFSEWSKHHLHLGSNRYDRFPPCLEIFLLISLF